MSDKLTPITRKETFLAKAGGQNVVTPTPITREETFLQAIIDNGAGGGGGSVLPAVTSEDAGKVLTVSDDGEWVAGGGGGTGGGVLVVSPNLDTGVLDKTWKEITDAPFAVLKFTDDNITYQICPLSSYDEKAQGVYYNVKFKLNEELSFTAFTNDPDGYPILIE